MYSRECCYFHSLWACSNSFLTKLVPDSGWTSLWPGSLHFGDFSFPPLISVDRPTEEEWLYDNLTRRKLALAVVHWGKLPTTPILQSLKRPCSGQPYGPHLQPRSITPHSRCSNVFGAPYCSSSQDSPFLDYLIRFWSDICLLPTLHLAIFYFLLVFSVPETRVSHTDIPQKTSGRHYQVCCITLVQKVLIHLENIIVHTAFPLGGT